MDLCLDQGCPECRKRVTLLRLFERDAPSPDARCSACGTQEYETFHVLALASINHKLNPKE